MHSHNTEDCYELKKIRDDRHNRWNRDGPARGGGCGIGRGGGRGGGRWGGHGHHHQPNPQANAAQPRLDEENNNLPEDNAGGYQEPRGMACILGGAQAPSPIATSSSSPARSTLPSRGL